MLQLSRGPTNLSLKGCMQTAQLQKPHSVLMLCSYMLKSLCARWLNVMQN